MTEAKTEVENTTEEKAKPTTKKTTAKKSTAKKEAVKKEPKVRDRKNGITRPGIKTTSGKIWAIADEISKKMQEPAPRRAVIEATEGMNLNAATVATQYGRWCKYHGLVNPRQPKEEKVVEEKTTDNAKTEEVAA